MKTRLRLPLFTFLLTLLCLGMSPQGWGQVSITSGNTSYTQNFTGFLGSADPVNWITSNVGGAEASTWIGTDSGTNTGGGKRSYGTGSGATFEGSLGFLPSGSRAINADISFINNTGEEIVGFDIAYVAEHWRSASGGRNNGWAVSYRINAGTFVNLNSLTYVAPNNLATGANPSGGAWSTNPRNQIVTGISIPAGATVTFRFFGDNGTGGGSRQGVAIDDFSVNFTLGGGGGSPLLAVNPTSLTGFEYTESNGPSPSQSFDLSGANLDGTDVDVALPLSSDFEISADDLNFFDSLNFPAYDGTSTTIYVRLKSGLAVNTYTDNIAISGGGADPVSVGLSGEVQPEPVLGWQINAANTPFVIDFDTTVNGVNEGQYAGTGFEPAPATGRLNSNAFAVTGWSEGNLAYGDTNTSGDYARGNSTGGVGTGGFYAFEVAPGNRAFGFQPGGNDFAPGSVTLRLQNQTGSAVETLRLTYTVYVYNDQERSGNVNFSYSGDNITFTQQPLLEVLSAEAADASPQWVATTYTVLIGLENIPDNGFYYLRWDSNDVAGSGSRDEFAIDDITLTANPDNLVYTQSGNLAFPIYHFNGTLQPGDDLLAIGDPVNFNFGDMDFGNITIQPGASVLFTDNLKLGGDLINNGSLTFISNATTTAQLDAVPATSSVLGPVEIQRYIPARRAFRLLSSAVTTSGTINANWQEGAANATANPNPGFGTHITGSTTGANGFDATPSGNPSLFTLNNIAQAWEAVTNTNVNTIAAGTPYRLLVRGDRSINVTSNSAPPTNTTLRTTGTLHTGAYTFTNFSEVENEFNFFGNPYPAAVDMNAVLALLANNNINPNRYYIWDPTLNTRGKYVTIDLPAGTNSDGSAGNLYLQPGQAAFVTTLANGPASLTFQESNKNVAAPNTAVFSTDNRLDLRLYEAGSFADNGPVADGLRIKFAEGNTNALNNQDAPKFYNLDENLATSNDNRLWSIESRALPLEGESIPLFTNQYRHTDYVFEIELTELTGVTAVLRDHYTGTDTELAINDTSLYAFNVDPADPNSIATDRFEIVFEELLGTREVAFGNNFILFPNPAQGEINLSTKGISGDEVTVSITNVLGQTFYTASHTVQINGQLSVDTTPLAGGIYILKLTHANGGQYSTKFIKK